jgi:Spy/CpxP family protein refolding chaperone
MHPGMMAWWKRAQAQSHCGPHAGAWAGGGGCGPGPSAEWEHHAAAGDHEGEVGGGAFGVRRPLRFLAYKLELDDKQVDELARVLNELKTERAQAAVDNRRTIAGFADAVGGDAFDPAKVGEIAADRVKSAERLRDAVVKALGRIHAILRPDQRQKLAYLIRTGAITI